MVSNLESLNIGYLGFDHQLSTALSAFGVTIVCTALIVITCCCKCLPSCGAIDRYAINGFLAFMGMGTGFFGVAHVMLDSYYESGAPLEYRWLVPGQGIDGTNIWLYFWATWEVCDCIAPAVLVSCALTPIASGKSQCNEMISNVCQFLVYLTATAVAVDAIYEFHQNQDIDGSQKVVVLWGMLAGAVTVVVNILCFFGLGGEGCCHVQRVLMAVGGFLFFDGWAIIGFEAHACLKTGEARYGCPYLSAFNQIVWFHICIALSALFVCMSVWCTPQVTGYTTLGQMEPESAKKTSKELETLPVHETKPARQPTFFESMFCCNRRGPNQLSTMTPLTQTGGGHGHGGGPMLSTMAPLTQTGGGHGHH